tara:strand:- start:49 stop:597 length:549 start_codon:yes stop_codon:yes gene_type:complete
MAERKYKKLFSGLIDVCYSQFYIESEDPDDSDSCEEQFQGQNNGLCGAATPERIFFTARPKDSVIDLDINLYTENPEINDEYTDIVEVSFRPGEEPVFLCQWAHEEVYPLNLENIDYRVRYSIVGLDNDYDYDEDDDEYFQKPVPGQKYLIEIWPQEKSRDQIVKQTSMEAAYWHKEWGSRK